MSSTRLLVLGVVRLLQPVHGYDVRRMLLSWRADEWASVNPGSIYHALKTATRDGQCRTIGEPARGGRPDRTAYELTEHGEFDFLVLLREALWKLGDATTLRAGLCFFPVLGRDELLSLLRRRLTQLEAVVESSGFTVSAPHPVTPRHVVEQIHLSAALSEGEARWVGDMITRVERGDYHRPDGTPHPVVKEV
ncbi:MAG TPA: PadR family transcriptional regulator [Pseudonocardiaceae bacterium]